jgi:hypothetical protein
MKTQKQPDHQQLQLEQQGQQQFAMNATRKHRQLIAKNNKNNKIVWSKNIDQQNIV